MSWLSSALKKVEKEAKRTIDKVEDVAEDVWESDIGRAAVIAGGTIATAGLAGPALLGAASAGGQMAGSLLGTIGSIGKAAVGAAGAGIKTIASVGGKVATTAVKGAKALPTIVDKLQPAAEVAAEGYKLYQQYTQGDAPSSTSGTDPRQEALRQNSVPSREVIFPGGGGGSGGGTGAGGSWGPAESGGGISLYLLIAGGAFLFMMARSK